MRTPRTTAERRQQQLKALLDDAYDRFARPDFIAEDPIHIPRSFARREDAEIIGFITATIAWGQRKTIIANSNKLVTLLDDAPHDYILHAGEQDLARLDRFVHRTFNSTDLRHFVFGLRHVYAKYGDLENAFLNDTRPNSDAHSPASFRAADAIALFKQRFFEIAHPPRTRKHVADPAKGSNAKRINMYLRWMVRPNDRGVDLGLWKRIAPAHLMVPLDVHTGRVSRALGLLERTQDDWKAVEELTAALRVLDPADPVKYDIALFALGVTETRK